MKQEQSSSSSFHHTSRNEDLSDSLISVRDSVPAIGCFFCKSIEKVHLHDLLHEQHAKHGYKRFKLRIKSRLSAANDRTNNRGTFWGM